MCHLPLGVPHGAYVVRAPSLAMFPTQSASTPVSDCGLWIAPELRTRGSIPRLGVVE